LDSPIEKIGLHCPVNMKWFLNTSKKFVFCSHQRAVMEVLWNQWGLLRKLHQTDGWWNRPSWKSCRIWKRQNSNFRFIATMTGMARSKKTWKGETGLINQEMLSKYLNDLPGPIYYIRRASRHGQRD
jgi:hypothetical protein